jgi:hypothetical protein
MNFEKLIALEEANKEGKMPSDSMVFVGVIALYNHE